MKKAIIILLAIVAAVMLFTLASGSNDTRTPAQKAQDDLASAQAMTQDFQQALDEQMQKIQDMQNAYNAYTNAQSRLGN